MLSILEVLRIGPVIPVLVIDEVNYAVSLARALVEGGVRVLEVTLRTPISLGAIRAITREVEGAIVGAGTILRPRDFDGALEAGAAFGVSPGLTLQLIDAARRSGLALLPGAMTPSDIIQAKAAGFNELKFFPAQQAGGVDMLKALSGPFPDVTFCPTGGVTASNAPKYLALPNVACVGGSWLTPKELIASRNWQEITRLAQAASSLTTARP